MIALILLLAIAPVAVAVWACLKREALPKKQDER
jgi:hypothetical protein